MITSYKHKGLKRFADTGNTSGLPVQNANRIRLALLALDDARRPRDMDVHGYFFHALKGDRDGTYFVRVTGNWRMTFEWAGADAINVNLEDYH